MRAPVTADYVATKLKQAKKPNSYVAGDLLPRLMKIYHHLLVTPVTSIFNAVFATGEWPASWKKETAVIIPKVSAPSSLAECRNISCTNFLSKVLESILLEDLRREIPVDPAQYGGLKGSSVDHLLVDAWDSILRPLDHGSHAVMLGIDYQKAFNRLDHSECLRQLRELGASTPSINLVRSFLTKLSPDASPDPSAPSPVELPSPSLPGRFGPDNLDDNGSILFFKYVDDTTTVEAIPGNLAIKHFSVNAPQEEVFPVLTGALLDKIVQKTEEIGMLVNCEKTQLLCISLENGCNTTTRLTTGSGITIKCSDTMKLLGFMFGNAPNCNAQFDFIRKKFRARFWSIIHLRKAGIRGIKLFRLYSVFVRPIIETNAVIYDSMLTKYQSEQLEMMQKRVLRLCFGNETHYEQNCRTYGISTLADVPSQG